MSGVAVIVTLLAADAGVTAIVPAARIFGGDVPLSTATPSIGVSQISGMPRNTVSMAETRRLITERVQVTIHAASYDQQKALLELVRRACPNQRGTVDGVDLDSILPDIEGPDLTDADAKIYEQSRDFLVKWRTAP